MVSKMLMVFDNIVFDLQQAGGVSRFWSNIIEPYNNADNVLFIEHNGRGGNIYRRSQSLARTIRDHRLPIQFSRYINFSQEFFNKPYVFHSSYFRINTAPNCVNVTTVHDLFYEKFGNGLGALLHLRQKSAALRKSDYIVCVSEHTRKELFHYYPFCSSKRVVVISNGVNGFYPYDVNSGIFKRVNYDNSAPYFLYVGKRSSRFKGFNLVYDALDLLEGELRCIVVGEPFSKAELAEIHERGHEKIILNVGNVSDPELNDLYSQAKFFFFPSIYEGFGIPPLEAMLSGCPVLASNRSSVPEVVGDAGILFDPSDLETLKSGLSLVLQEDIRVNLIALGFERAMKFSWKSVVKQYSELYMELMLSAPELT